VTTEVAVTEARPLDGVDDLEPALLDAFPRRARDAVTGGRPVAVVRDADLLGRGEPAEPAAWVERLGSADRAGGALVRLGDLHLGRVPV
jgi:hypothetical protein